MRPSALFPALCCAAALVLSFLCLFAGHKRNFMEDYHLLTLNTSRIGENLLNSSTAGNSDNPLSTLFHNITNSISGDVNNFVGDLASRLGVEDFYSAHLLDYCYGSYVPTPLANATVSKSEIHKNVTKCSNQTAMYQFDPTSALQKSLNDSGVDITLADLNWPDDIQKGVNALHILQKAVFILYCISIGLTSVALITSLLGVFTDGRLTAFINFMVVSLDFIALALASAIVTVVIVKGSNVIDKYGKEIGVEAHKGAKFMAITWAATGLITLALLGWFIECIIGHRKRGYFLFPSGPRSYLESDDGEAAPEGVLYPG